MATDLDPRTAEWTNTDMVLVNDDVYTETFAGAIAEDVGFSAYRPRLLVSQQDQVMSASGTFVSEDRRVYIQQGTYDVYAQLKLTYDVAGSFNVSLDGTTIIGGTGDGRQTGSTLGYVTATAGGVDMQFQVAGVGSNKGHADYGVVYLRFVAADF